MSKTKAELLKDNEQLRRRVASLERAMDQRPVAAKDSEELRLALAEAREQQTATSEILRVISSSPTDIQPVLQAVTENASRLCRAANVSLYRVEGDLMRKVAEHEEGLQLTSLRVGETRSITPPASVAGPSSIGR
jgi:hypothetical protein